MKKTVSLILAILTLCLCLSGCGAEKTVPEKTIEWVVEDYLANHCYFGGYYTGYNTSVTHSPDKETKTDTVNIELTINYPHSVAVTSYEATYQYYKANDIWEIVRGDSWERLCILRYDMASSAKIWLEEIQNVGYDAMIECEGAQDVFYYLGLDDFAEFTGMNVEKLEKGLVDGWEISFDWGENAAFCLKMNTEQLAKEVYNCFGTIIKQEFGYSFDAAEGENYEYLRATDYDNEAYAVFIRIDNTVFGVGAGYGDRHTAYDIDLFLQNVGFVPQGRG